VVGATAPSLRTDPRSAFPITVARAVPGVPSSGMEKRILFEWRVQPVATSHISRGDVQAVGLARLPTTAAGHLELLVG